MATLKDVNPSYRFRLEFDGLQTANFQKAEGLNGKVSVRSYEDGGEPLPTKQVGKPEFDNQTLEYGATQNMELWQWFRKSLNGITDKRSAALIVFNDAGREVERWNIFGCFPIEFNPGTWDATQKDGNQMRKIVLAYDNFDAA
jgi:phage tail-like protein